MYPTLTDFFKDVFGINIPLPIQSYGFFVALAFLTGIFILAKELKRKENEGLLQAVKKRIRIGEPAKISTLVLSGIGGFIIGFKLLEAVLHYSDLVNDPQGFILSSRGNFLGGLVGAAASAYLTWRDKDKARKEAGGKAKWIDKEILPHQMAGNILIVAAIFGLLGAKLFHNLENFGEFLDDPIEALISFSGLTFLGGLIVGIGSVLIYTKRYHIPSLYMVDAAAPALALAYGVGRLGCQISGDGCWGIPNPNPKPDWMSFLPDWLWSFDYPHNVINEGQKIADCMGKHCHVLDVPVFPTPLYETMMMFTIFLVLWGIRKKVKMPGIMFSLFITLAGFERFFIERIRVNNEYNIFGYGITQAQIISSIMILAGIAAIILFYKKGDKINAWLNAKMKIKEVEDASNSE